VFLVIYLKRHLVWPMLPSTKWAFPGLNDRVVNLTTHICTYIVEVTDMCHYIASSPLCLNMEAHR